MLEPGVILGDFEIRRFLGRGGMGDVYEARQRSLGRSVALKTLPAAVSLDQHVLNRFQREASIAAQLDHPNIIPVYAFGVSGPNAYFAMKLVRGMTVARFIQHCQPIGDIDQSQTVSMPHATGLPEDHNADNVEIYVTPSSSELSPQLRKLVEAYRGDPGGVTARIGRDLAQALDYAHRLGHLHRDIKPHNVMLDEEGQVYLIDFGLTRTMVAHSTEHRSGTPRYMSPEQFDLEKLDGRTDVYSLGVTLYELLTGRPAFRAPETGGLGRMVRMGEVEPLTSAVPGVAPELARCIARAMAPDRDQRYATAGVFAAALATFTRPPEARRRMRLRGAVLATVAMLFCIAAIALWSSQGRTPAARGLSGEPTTTRWVADRQLDLLGTKPIELAGSESRWGHDREAGLLTVESPEGLTVLSLGEAPGSRFELNVEMLDVIPVDNLQCFAGVFWLWQTDPDQPDSFLCESLQLERMHSNAGFEVSWRRPTVRNNRTRGATGAVFLSGGFAPRAPHRFRVRVIDGRTEFAEWNGTTLQKVSADRLSWYPAIKHTGPVGVICYRARTVVTGFQVTALKRSE